MAKRQNFVVGSTNPNTESRSTEQLNNGWNRYEVLKSGVLDGVFNAVSDFSNDSSNEIANAIVELTGSQPTGETQTELATALHQMREDIETTSLTFMGYVSATQPSASDYDFQVGNIWIQSATLPTSFPVAIAGVWNGTQWESTTNTYTQKDFDFFRNVNDNEGYYWFGGQWVVMSTDMSTTYFTLNQTSGKWEIKSSVNLPGAPTAATPTSGSSSSQIATKGYVDSAISGVGDYHPELLSHEWDDHERSDMNWVNALTFSWQDRTDHQVAYDELASNISGKTLQSETISGTTVQFYLADNGRKICPATQESNVAAIYAATGVAWYYIIDTTNRRFKLPRIDPVRKMIADSAVVKTSSTEVYDPTGQEEMHIARTNGAAISAWWTLIAKNTGSQNETALSNYYAGDIQDNSGWAPTNLIADLKNATGSYFAGAKYLYFYVGGYTQSAVENTAGLNAELFNNKVDVGHEVIAFQRPTSANNYTWYRKYADGWVEQGGRVAGSASDAAITFPIIMADSGYYINGHVYSNTDANSNWIKFGALNTTGTTYVTGYGSDNRYGLPAVWEVKGIAAN